MSLLWKTHDDWELRPGASSLGQAFRRHRRRQARMHLRCVACLMQCPTHNISREMVFSFSEVDPADTHIDNT
jgi:hypothetical protein